MNTFIFSNARLLVTQFLTIYRKELHKLVPSLTAPDQSWLLILPRTQLFIVIPPSLSLVICMVVLGRLLGHSQIPWLRVFLLEALLLVGLHM
jgi:hypothetical protein